jgi:hypothetical protein
MIAVTQNGHEVQYAAEELREDPEVILAAAAQCPDGSVLKYAAPALLEDDEFLDAAREPWVALENLRTAECRLRAEQGSQLRRQLRDAEERAAAASSGARDSRAALAQRQHQAERAAADRLAEQTRMREAAEYRANLAERKSRAAQGDESPKALSASTTALQEQLAEAQAHLQTEKRATRHARKATAAASQSASQARRELSAALKGAAAMEAQLSEAQQKLRAREREMKRLKTTSEQRIASLEEDLGEKSRLVEHSQRSVQAELRDSVENDKAQVQIQWVGSLHRAIEAQDLGTVRKLLNSGNGARAAVTAQVDGTLAPMPMHRAIRKGDLEIVRRLMAEFTKAELPAILSLQDAHSGFTCLHMAVEYGHADVVDTLIRARCDTTVHNRRGKTAWEHAKLLTGCKHVSCVDSVFHMHAHAHGKHGCTNTQLALELERQLDDTREVQETYSDPIEIDTRSLHTWSLDTFANWNRRSALSGSPFGWRCEVAWVFPSMQVGNTVHGTMALKIAKPGCKAQDLHSEVKRLGSLTRNPECPANIVQVLGIVYGRAEKDGPETWMMATEMCESHLLDLILPDGSFAQHYSTELVLEQAQGIAWGMSYLHSRNMLHSDLRLKHIKLKRTGGCFTAKIDGLINSAKFSVDGDRLHDTASDDPDLSFGGNDVHCFGTMLIAMLTREDDLSESERIATPDLVPPMCKLLTEACWSSPLSERLNFEQVHRLLNVIDASTWMAPNIPDPSSSHADGATHVAEAVPPEPTPTCRLLRMLSDLEVSLTTYPYEMELLRRKLEGLRLQSEQKLKAQLQSERQLNAQTRELAIGAATSALVAEVKAKEQEIEAVRRYSNSSIDLLQASILEMGKFSEAEIAVSIASSRTQLQGSTTEEEVRTLQTAAATAALRHGQENAAAVQETPEVSTDTDTRPKADDSHNTQDGIEIRKAAAKASGAKAAAAKANITHSDGGAARHKHGETATTNVFDRLHSYSRQGSSVRAPRRESHGAEQHVLHDATDASHGKWHAHTSGAGSPNRSGDSASSPRSRRSPRKPAPVHQRTRALIETLGMHSSAATLYMSPKERHSRERGAILKSLQEAMHAKRLEYGDSIEDPERVFAALDHDGSGTLSSGELISSLRRLGLSLSTEQLDRLISFLDRNGDGTSVDYIELLEVLKSPPGEYDVDEVDEAEDSVSVLTVVCPDGCRSGDSVTIVLDDSEIDVVIPKRVRAGMEFDIEY